MSKALIPLLLIATPCWAHPGHGAPIGHLHYWDWGHLLIGFAIAAIVAVATWRAR